EMDGDLDDMGMNMSLNQMDMNVVMYPEITGELKKKKIEDAQSTAADSSDQKIDHDMKGMDHSTHQMYNSNAMSDITTLNYAMLRAPEKTNLPKDVLVKELFFELTGNMNRYVWSLD